MNAQRPRVSWLAAHGKGNIEVLEDRSLTVTHNLGVFGGCGLVLSIITGLFGINVDGMPGADGSPYAFLLFSGILFLLGIVLIAIGLLYLGLKNPIIQEDVEMRKLELQELVRMFKRKQNPMHNYERLFLDPICLQLLQIDFLMVQIMFSSANHRNPSKLQ
ncbi:hypothetical protein CFP56_011224 [Quercus suber]|uniref:Uncharacterized protein n=1 Tax=Quercus suber TaxID=58331 RepID=A0AAW0MEN5_QUESU